MKEVKYPVLQHKAPILAINFSPDGKSLLSVDGNNIIKVWNLKLGQCVKTITDVTCPVSNHTFSPDGTLVASTDHSKNSAFRFLEINRAKAIKTTDYHSAHVMFHPDRKHVLAFNSPTDSPNKDIKLCDIKGNVIATLGQYFINSDATEFSPDGKLLASTVDNGTKLKLWEIKLLKSGTKADQSTKTLDTNGYGSKITFSSDSKLLAVSNIHNNSTKLLNVETGEYITNIGSKILPITFSQESPFTFAHNYLTAFSANGKCLKAINTTITAANDSITFSYNGKLLAVVLSPNKIKFYQQNEKGEFKPATTPLLEEAFLPPLSTHEIMSTFLGDMPLYHSAETGDFAG